MELEAKMLEDKKSSLNTDIKNISNQIDNATEELYQKSYNLMQEKLSQSADISRKQYQKVDLMVLKRKQLKVTTGIKLILM